MIIQKALSRQLKNPTGLIGLITGLLMNKANSEMYSFVLNLTPFTPGDKILEVGFGSGRHISRLVSMSQKSIYTGIDISPTMIRSATRYNSDLIERKIVRFVQADISKLPFNDCTFDRVITLNTIYFWDNPVDAMKEMARVLKPGGSISLGANSKDEMIKQGYRPKYFSFWDSDSIEQLFYKAGLINISSAYSKLKIEDCISVVAVKSK
jgi:ubiquinone/menaquinone biosynthesis C-methylase UbiE